MKNLLCTLLLFPVLAFAQESDCYSLRDYNELTTQANPTLVRDLSSGWNMLGYPCAESNDVVAAFAEISDNILILKDNNGAAYWPEFGFNGIGNLIALEGYQIKLIAQVSDFSFCEGVVLPSVEGCVDCQAINFDPWATTDDGSCNYDTDGDGIYDVDEIEGCLALSACNYNELATDEGACSFAQEGYDCDGNLLYQIGDYAGGGIVFHIDHEESKAYVVAYEDVTDIFSWGCEGLEIGDTYDAIGWSDANSQAIVDACHTSDCAAYQATEYYRYEINDWFLPTISELEKIYEVRELLSAVQGFDALQNDYYWSSSEVDLDHAKSFDFYMGAETIMRKYTNKPVRPVRVINF